MSGLALRCVPHDVISLTLAKMAVTRSSWWQFLIITVCYALIDECNIKPSVTDLVQLPCRRLLAEYNQAVLAKPLPQLNESMKAHFTMGGKMAFQDFFVDDSLGGQGTHYRYSRKQLDKMIKESAKQLEGAAKQSASPSWKDNPARVPQHIKDSWFIHAIARLNFQEARVAILGSTEPWLEAVAIAAGATDLVTVDYNKLTYEHPAITTMQPSSFYLEKRPFDYILSASSFDHDGLGRYGDPLQANGDLKAMRLCKCILKPGGQLLVSFPVGPDTIVYNLHRRYGRERLPHMLHGWIVQDVVAWDEDRLQLAVDVRHTYEPVFVLKRPIKKKIDKSEL
eukprot:TRINITY_DN5114_c0_g1_i1.p1 TRINITY_DN5114_c0_g1~~TRINITY_DN5114_c0_g1_i1.p1  ORF type:complete len:338 (+),score=55.37 TRINITY_DN5114_c0_g1_i1:856-1869(+)